jgi:hypothetical protein
MAGCSNFPFFYFCTVDCVTGSLESRTMDKGGPAHMDEKKQGVWDPQTMVRYDLAIPLRNKK